MGLFFTDVNWVLGIILFTAFSILLFYFSIILYRQARESSREMGERNIYLYSVVLFFFFLGIAYVIRTYFMFILPDDIITFSDNLTLTVRDDPMIQLFWQIHMFFAFLGIGILMIGVEKNILKGHSKYLIAAATLIFNIFIIALPYDVIHPIHFPLLFTILIVLFAYIYVGVRGSGGVSKNAYAIVCGFVIFFVGILLNSTTVRRIFEEIFGTSWPIVITAIIAPIALIIGFLILARGYQNKF